MGQGTDGDDGDMNYEEYLELCKNASAKTYGFSQLSAKFKPSELVTYKARHYIPAGGIVWFDKDGNQRISATVREQGRNAVLQVPIEEVSRND